MSDFKSFEISNYKSIKESGKVDIDGITILLGANSSGKSSLLESLILLKQSFDSGSPQLVLNGNHIKLGEYQDIVHKKEIDRTIEFKFNFNRDSRRGDSEYECPICHREYSTNGWYTNHLADEHPRFWEQKEDDIEDYEAFLTAESYFRIEYGYDERTKSSSIFEIEFGNPPPNAGLFLSNIKLEIVESGIRISARDLYGNQIMSVVNNEMNPQELFNTEITGVPNLMNRALVSSLPLIESPERYLFFLNEPESEMSDLYPTAFKYIDIFKPYFENNPKQLDSGGDNIVKVKDTKYESEEILGGFVDRLTNILRSRNQTVQTIDFFLKNIAHIGPLRNNPRRIYFGSGGSPQQGYFENKNIEEMIFRDRQVSESELITQANEWLNKTGFDCKVDVSPVGVGDLYQLNVDQDGLSVNLADAGFGISQTLPIIVECVNMELRRAGKIDESQSRRRHPRELSNIPKIYMMLIEQPEIHLNPKIEAALGDFFIDVMESDINMIIETHSEHLLNRLQRRVADGTVENAEDISIYFFENDENVSEIEKIEMTNNGTFDNWPQGFFQDDLDEAIEILKESL